MFGRIRRRQLHLCDRHKLGFPYATKRKIVGERRRKVVNLHRRQLRPFASKLDCSWTDFRAPHWSSIARSERTVGSEGSACGDSDPQQIKISTVEVMARTSVDPLVVGRVIGDVIDMFEPSVDMAVLYTARQVSNGCQMKPSATTQAPDIQVSDRNATDNLFTLIMTDPDAPSPSEPSMREWVHWIVTDIPGGSPDSSSGYVLLKELVQVPAAPAARTKGTEIVPYLSPRPPIGIHRYIFVLFKQPAGPLLVSPPSVRNNFNTRNFAAEHGLGLPVAATYFNAQKEPGSRRR